MFQSSEPFLSWPKVELKSSEDFPMLAQRIRNVSKVHPSILKTNRFLIFLRQEKSTAILNLAIMLELPEQKWKIHQKLGIYVLGFYCLTEIQSDSLLCAHENEEGICLVSFNMWFYG